MLEPTMPDSTGDRLQETCQYDGAVNWIEMDDVVSGGHGAPINLQATNIANRTLYLKSRLDLVPKILRYVIGREQAGPPVPDFIVNQRDFTCGFLKCGTRLFPLALALKLSPSEVGTLEEELNYLATTKELIKHAMQSRGFPVTESTPLSEYPKMLDAYAKGTELYYINFRRFRCGIDRLTWPFIDDVRHVANEKMRNFTIGFFRCGTYRLFYLDAGLHIQDFALSLQFWGSYDVYNGAFYNMRSAI